MKSAAFVWAETALCVWGWGIANLGMQRHVTTSMLGRMIEEGPGASASTAPVLAIDSPPDVAAIALVIDELDEDIRDVLHQRYVRRYSDRVGAHRLAMSRAEYRRRLHIGIAFVAGALVMNKRACPDGPLAR